MLPRLPIGIVRSRYGETSTGCSGGSAGEGRGAPEDTPERPSDSTSPPTADRGDNPKSNTAAALRLPRAAAVFDATSGLATIAVMGPRSRELMTRISPAEWGDEAHPYSRAREVEIASGHALVLRTSFVGELGYEIYPSADLAVDVYDAVVRAGDDLGLVHAGYHALDSLRCEKGYRHLGHDIGPGVGPAEAGLMFAVSKRKKVDFVGRAAVERVRQRLWRTAFVRLDDPRALLHHDEPVLQNGRRIGRVTSGAYGWTIGGACGVALVEERETLWLDEDPIQITVTCGKTPVPATLSAKPFYDPSGSRLR